MGDQSSGDQEHDDQHQRRDHRVNLHAVGETEPSCGGGADEQGRGIQKVDRSERARRIIKEPEQNGRALVASLGQLFDTRALDRI